jgi:16S rRNA (guanine(966)-N(2))-methyltransferase RsmD
MRIIGGTAAGVILDVPKGYDLRPTPDLVRQAIFNSLGERVVGARVLELFGGTAALSLECLSRGAVQATCVELARTHARFIEKNLELSRLARAAFHLRVQDVFTAIAQLATAGEQFDLILADPPFGEKNSGRRSTSLSQKLLDHPVLPALLSRAGLFVLGHARRDVVTLSPPWMEQRELRHGDSMIRMLQPGINAPTTTKADGG